MPPRVFVDTVCPPDMAPIPTGGCIDRWEASAGPGELGPSDGKKTTVVAVSAPERKPLADVTVRQAERACRNAGKRLCNEHQWRSACEGRKGWRYAYGNDFEHGRCQDWEASDHGRRGATLTGKHPDCVTREGVYDLANNLGELVSTVEPSGRYAVRGGTYNMTVGDSACDEDDYTLLPVEHGPDVGFRCCSDGKR